VGWRRPTLYALFCFAAATMPWDERMLATASILHDTAHPYVRMLFAESGTTAEPNTSEQSYKGHHDHASCNMTFASSALSSYS